MKEEEVKQIEDFLTAHAKRGPNIFGQAVNLGLATRRVANAVIAREPVLVSKDEIDYRLSVCRSCDLWDENGNVGLGKCNHEKCGCTKLKQGLATEKCPINKWNYKKED